MYRLILNSPAHLIAAACAVVYIWQVSLTPLRSTGLQFVAPLAVILSVHLAWLCLTRGFVPGTALRVFARGGITATALAVTVMLASIFAPKPAMAADVGEVVTTVLTTLFCVAIVAGILAVIGLILYAIFGLFGAAIGSGSKDDDPKSRLFDLGSLMAGGLILAIASAEDVPGAYGFDSRDRATATYDIDAPVDAIWLAMETATSPDVALPDILSLFPRPAAVTIDEGVTLGAHRQVRFDGREGTGFLDLTVTSVTPSVVTFTVQSDTSPFAEWVRFHQLSYIVEPTRDGSRITTALTYDRELAPAWAFRPLVNAAATLAMDVLAGDVAARAAQLPK